jgi:hypothetical protein
MRVNTSVTSLPKACHPERSEGSHLQSNRPEPTSGFSFVSSKDGLKKDLAAINSVLRRLKERRLPGVAV